MNGELRALLHHLRRLVGPQGAGGRTDAQLLECFVAERDEAAFELLVWRHGPMVLSVCRRVLRQEQDAEDAFQATFLTFVRKARSIGKHEAVASWLYKVAYRIALEAKTLASKRNLREKQGADQLATRATEQPSNAAVWREIRPVLDEEVNRLPEKYRTPVVRAEVLARVRRDFVQAEEELRLVERMQTVHRERALRKLQAADEHLRGLQGSSTRIEPAPRGSVELERKVDRLLREITELRREIRRQPTDKNQQPPPERRPDQP